MSAQGPLSDPLRRDLDTARPAVGEVPPILPAERREDLSAVSHADPGHGESGTDSEPINEASSGKGKLVVFLLLAALAIGGLGYFFLTPRTTTPTAPAQTTSTPTAPPSATKLDESPARPSQEANNPAASSTEQNPRSAETPIRSAPAPAPAPWPDPPAQSTPPASAERPAAAPPPLAERSAAAPPPPAERPAAAPPPSAERPAAPPPAGTPQGAPPRSQAAVQNPAPAARNPEFLFLQRPGVNIRSAPSPTGRVVGSAPKGTRFEVTNRQGEWIEVNGGRLKGWISERFLGASAP